MQLSQVLQRCREGDELAWEALVRTYQARVYSVALHYVGSREDARDLAQEIFVRVYRNVRACPDGATFLPWLLRISRNAAIDHVRRQKARPPSCGVPAEEVAVTASDSTDPERQYAAADRRRLLERALARLSALNREIILLKDVHGLRLDEIARMLRVPLGTVKSRSNRARLELAEKVLELSR
jgi:RNA polymerase sigma-70 factor (ECF subfamily)